MNVGISVTTRNRPRVLEYTLAKTREVFDGQIICIDDNSDTKAHNESICKKYDCLHLFNDTRYGIPRSKERGFRSLLTFDQQIWLDDDCYLKEGAIERLTEAMEMQPHLLYLRDWAHVKEIDRNCGIVEYSGATACLMTFTKEIYDKVKGFHVGHPIYGGWHHTLSLKLGGYYSIENAQDYIHSFDIDKPPKDFNYSFGSSLPQHERIKKK